MRSPGRVLAALLSTLLLATGCDPLIDDPAKATPRHPGTASSEVAREQLGALGVAAWASMSGYSRDRFHHWISQGNGCDTRDVVLRRDGEGVVTADDCTITRGAWVSPYDGVTVNDSHDVDIDHMVPLANAWRTGAATWTDDRREAFANDLDRPQLLAVTASTNRSKGDQDPSQWRPPREAFWCTYATSWIAVKSYWKLTVSTAEKAALEDMLETC